jgi:DNA-binding NarL/FixJ family response regulator
MKKIRVLIADPCSIFCRGLCHLLKLEKDIECVGIAQSDEEVLKRVPETEPEVLTLAFGAEMDGVQLARQIRTTLPRIRIIILSHYKCEKYLVGCMDVGVEGYLLKEIEYCDLANSIRMVHKGECIYHPEIARKFISKLSSAYNRSGAEQEALGSRELSVLRLAAKGMSNKMISREMGISTHTVAIYLTRCFAKMHVGSRTEAVARALKEGLFDLDDI